MDDFEQLLHRYRPVGPPPGLYDRLTARPVRREWLAPVAATIASAAAAVLIALGTDARQLVARELEDFNPLRDGLVEELTDAFGGTELARREAERLMLEEETARDRNREAAAVAGVDIVFAEVPAE